MKKRHRETGWPQALPGGKFLYLAANQSPGKGAVYAASLRKPNERMRLITSDTNALFGPGGDGTDYLVWYRDGNLVAQEFDVHTLSLRDEAHEVVKSTRVAVNFGIIASVSANGSLLFSTTAADPSSLAWFSREGRLLGTVGEPAEYLTCRLSPDGRRLAASRSESKGPHVIPTQNPRWIAYMSDETGRYEIFVDSFPEPGRKTRVSISGGRFAQWRRDGRELYFLSADYKLMAVNIKPRSDAVETSAPRELFPVPAAENLASPYEVAPDGQRFLVRMAAQQSEPLTLILNWPALMKGQAPR